MPTLVSCSLSVISVTAGAVLFERSGGPSNSLVSLESHLPLSLLQALAVTGSLGQPRGASLNYTHFPSVPRRQRQRQRHGAELGNTVTLSGGLWGGAYPRSHRLCQLSKWLPKRRK